MDTGREGYTKRYLANSVGALNAFADDARYTADLIGMADAITAAMNRGRKLLVAGNGGSAGDSQHIAGEFISRLMFNRPALPAIALTVDTSVLTAVGNDYGFEFVFDRQIVGLGQEGDVFLGISTSGTSKNVVRALTTARECGLVTIGFTGESGGPMRDLCDHLLEAPSPQTAIIQQIHIVAAHIVCALVERSIFGESHGGA